MPTPDDSAPLRVLVIDDEPTHRMVVRVGLESRSDAELVGEAHNGRRGVELAAELQPDVVVLDLRMPIMDGMTALPLILRVAPFARVVVWSSADAFERARVLEAGAAACVRKTAPLEELMTALLQQTAAA
jgi:DNA-binding NarL/FixJ family response regulator